MHDNESSATPLAGASAAAAIPQAPHPSVADARREGAGQADSDEVLCCGVCSRVVPPGFRLRGGDIRCARHVIQHSAVWHRSLITALIVGTVLTGINQGNIILHHGFTSEILLKMGLTYCVPFAVSTSGGLGAARVRTAS